MPIFSSAATNHSSLDDDDLVSSLRRGSSGFSTRRRHPSRLRVLRHLDQLSSNFLPLAYANPSNSIRNSLLDHIHRCFNCVCGIEAIHSTNFGWKKIVKKSCFSFWIAPQSWFAKLALFSQIDTRISCEAAVVDTKAVYNSKNKPLFKTELHQWFGLHGWISQWRPFLLQGTYENMTWRLFHNLCAIVPFKPTKLPGLFPLS